MREKIFTKPYINKTVPFSRCVKIKFSTICSHILFSVTENSMDINCAKLDFHRVGS